MDIQTITARKAKLHEENQQLKQQNLAMEHAIRINESQLNRNLGIITILQELEAAQPGETNEP